MPKPDLTRLRRHLDELCRVEARLSAAGRAGDRAAAANLAWVRRQRLAVEAELDRLANPDPAARWAPSLSLFEESA